MSTRTQDSRRYHSRSVGPRVRAFNFSNSSSDPKTVSPFGYLPNNIANLQQTNFAKPLAQGFGFNGGAGPTASFINQATPVLNDYIGGQTNVANQITQQANSAYGGYQQAVDAFMNQLPGFQATAAGATAGAQQAQSAASTALEDAMSPLQSRASFQEASRRALAPAREAEAARGMLEGGQGQAGEQSLLSDLAFNALNTDKQNQQAAISGLSNASGATGQLAGNEAQLAGLGPQLQGALFSAYPQLAQLLTGASQMPLQGANSVLQFLQGTQNPAMSLLRMVLPQVAQTSSSFGFGFLK